MVQLHGGSSTWEIFAADFIIFLRSSFGVPSMKSNILYYWKKSLKKCRSKLTVNKGVFFILVHYPIQRSHHYLPSPLGWRYGVTVSSPAILPCNPHQSANIRNRCLTWKLLIPPPSQLFHLPVAVFGFRGPFCKEVNLVRTEACSVGQKAG